MLKKLRLKFVLTNIAIVTAMLLVIFGLFFHFTKEDLRRQGQSALQILSKSSQSLRPDNRVQLPYFVIQINTRGEILVSGNTHYDLADEDFLQELIQTVYTSKSSSGYIKKYGLLYNHVSGGSIQKLVFVDTSSQKAVLASLTQSSILIGLASLVVFLIISILLARWAVKPVAKAWQQQKQFVSDASHELKTPLTVIMGNAELLKSAHEDPEDAAHSADNILTMSYRMRDLVSGLLELARADNGQVEKTFAPLDLSKLVSDALLPFEPVLFEQGMTLEGRIEPGIRINGSEIYLQQLAGILLDNAGKYGAAGIVCVTLTRQSRSQCLLTVSNPGEPIPKEQLERIFERFYRTDQARTGAGSFGLGLSIARSVVQAHNGRIWAQSNETGNCFCVQLPCIPQ